MEIIRNFGVLYRTFLNYTSKHTVLLDLSFSDSVFLVNIGENQGISQEEIAVSLAIDKAAVARSVKNMEQKGYILVKKSAGDKRVKELYLSDTGRKLFQYVTDLNAKWLKHVFGDLDSESIKRFAQTISEISERAKSKKYTD